MEMKERVAELLEQGAAFYICGSADMARNVRQNLVQILAEFKAWDETQAESYIMGYMKRARLLQEDVWSN
jgi:sulfite reductase alpha subunit-like flavoprotein